MVRMSRKLVLVCLTAGSLLPIGAEAQMNPGLNSIMLDVQRSGIMAQVMSNTNEEVEIAGAPEAGALQAAPQRVPETALAYTASTSRRRAHYAQFVEKTRRVDPAGAKDLAATLASDPIAAMTPELAKVGLRTDNVADAYAVYWVEAWEAAHGESGHSSRETAQAVRAQAASAILSTPEFGTASEAQKQEFADALLVQALLIGAARDQAGVDTGKLRQIATAVRQGAKATGLDLDAMTLTDAGFVSARETGAAGAAPTAEQKALASGGTSRPGFGMLAAIGGAGLGGAYAIKRSRSRRG